MSDTKKTYCGKWDTAGQGLHNVCGKYVWGKDSPIYQCSKCIEKDLEKAQAKIAEQEGRIRELVKALCALRSIAIELDAYGVIDCKFKPDFELADKLISKHEANKEK